MQRQCVYCGSSDRILKDHFIPKAITGQDIYLIDACHSCNFSKSNRHPGEWYFRHHGDKEQWGRILDFVGLTEKQVDELMVKPDSGAAIRCKLSELIAQKGISQKTVAVETGINPATVGKLCHNHFVRIDRGTVNALSKYFKLKSIDDLFEYVVKE